MNQSKIIELLSQGKTIKAISHEMGVNKRTMEWRISKLKKKHGCANIAQLVLKLMGQKS